MKDLKIVLLILAVVLALVIAKTTGKNKFNGDVQETIGATLNKQFMVSEDDYNKSGSQFFVVEINPSGKDLNVDSGKFLKVQFENLTDGNTLKTLEQTDKKILLVSGDISVAMRAWIIVKQLGIENVFVLAEKDAEVLKYEFQPDTVERLEPVIE